MSVNKYAPHLLVMPEDDANRDLANGFILAPRLNPRVLQIMPPAGGWSKVVDRFEHDGVQALRKYPLRFVVLLVDFDTQDRRLNDIKAKIPGDLAERVFVLGVWSEPEELKSNLRKSPEQIGRALAEDCPENISDLWQHDLLRHNEGELARLIAQTGKFLFA